MNRAKKKIVEVKPIQKAQNKSTSGRQKRLPAKGSESLMIKKDVDKHKKTPKGKNIEIPKETDNKKKKNVMAVKTRFSLRSSKNGSELYQRTPEKDVKVGAKVGDHLEAINSENELKNETGKRKKNKVESESKVENESKVNNRGSDQTGKEANFGIHKTGVSNLGKSTRSPVVENAKTLISSALRKGSTREHTTSAEKQSTARISSKDEKEGKSVVKEGKGVIKDGKHLIKDGKNVIKDGKNVIKDGKNVTKDGKGVIKEGKNVIKDGKGLTKEGNNIIKDVKDKTEERNGIEEKDGKKGKKEKEVLNRTIKKKNSNDNICNNNDNNKSNDDDNNNSNNNSNSENTVQNVKGRDKRGFMGSEVPVVESTTFVGKERVQRMSMRIRNRMEKADDTKYMDPLKREFVNGTIKENMVMTEEKRIASVRKGSISSTSGESDRAEKALRRSRRKRKGNEQETSRETNQEIKPRPVSTEVKKKHAKVEENNVVEKELGKKKNKESLLSGEVKKGEAKSTPTKKDIIVQKKVEEKGNLQKVVDKEEKKMYTEQNVEKEMKEKLGESAVEKKVFAKESVYKLNVPLKADNAKSISVVKESVDVSKDVLEKKENSNNTVTKEKEVKESIKKKTQKLDRLSSSASSYENIKKNVRNNELLMEEDVVEPMKREQEDTETKEKKSEKTKTSVNVENEKNEEMDISAQTEKNKTEEDADNSSPVLEIKTETVVTEKRRGRKRKVDKNNELLNKLKTMKQNEDAKLENTYVKYGDRKHIKSDHSMAEICSMASVDTLAKDYNGTQKRVIGRRSSLYKCSFLEKGGLCSPENTNRDERNIDIVSSKKKVNEEDELYTLGTDFLLNSGQSKRKYVKRKYKKKYPDIFYDHVGDIMNNCNSYLQNSLSYRSDLMAGTVKYSKNGIKQDKKNTKQRLFPNETFMNKNEFLNNVNSINTVYSFNEEFSNFLSTASTCNDIQYKSMLQFLGTIQVNLSRSLNREYSNEFFTTHNVKDNVHAMEHLVTILNNSQDILNKLNQLEYKFFNDLLEKVNFQTKTTVEGLNLGTSENISGTFKCVNNFDPLKIKLRDFFERGKKRDAMKNAKGPSDKEVKKNENVSLQSGNSDELVKCENMISSEIGKEADVSGINCIQTDSLGHVQVLEDHSINFLKEGNGNEVDRNVDDSKRISLAEGNCENENSPGKTSDCTEKIKENINNSENSVVEEYFKKIDNVREEFDKAVEDALKNESSCCTKGGKSRYENATKDILYKNYMSTKVFRDNTVVRHKNNMPISTALVNCNMLPTVDDSGKDDMELKKYVDYFKENNYINILVDGALNKNKSNVNTFTVCKDNTHEISYSPAVMEHENSSSHHPPMSDLNIGDDLMGSLDVTSYKVEGEDSIMKDNKHCVKEESRTTNDSSVLCGGFAKYRSTCIKALTEEKKVEVENEQKRYVCSTDNEINVLEKNMKKIEESRDSCLNWFSPVKGEPESSYFRQATTLEDIENENMIRKSYSDTIAINSSTSMSDESIRNRLFDSGTPDKGDKSGEEKSEYNKSGLEHIVKDDNEKEEPNIYMDLKKESDESIDKSVSGLGKWVETQDIVLKEDTLLNNNEVTQQLEYSIYANDKSKTCSFNDNRESNGTSLWQEELQDQKNEQDISTEEKIKETVCDTIRDVCFVKEKVEEQGVEKSGTISNVADIETSKKIYNSLKRNFTYSYNEHTIADLLEETFNFKDLSGPFYSNTGKSPKEILDCLHMLSKIKKTFFDECTKMINNQIFLLEKNFHIPNCSLSVLKNSYGFNNS